jgi:putative endonuclease
VRSLLSRWRSLRDHLLLGRTGERLAARRLQLEGYRILDRNVQCGPYEIDIVAREGDVIAFVEVKTRRNHQAAEPEDNITATKRRHLRAAATRYIADHDDPDAYYRFDVAAIDVPEQGKPEIRLHRDAFRG